MLRKIPNFNNHNRLLSGSPTRPKVRSHVRSSSSINDASAFFSRTWAVSVCHLFRRDVIAQRQPTIFWQDTMNERLVCVCVWM